MAVTIREWGARGAFAAAVAAIAVGRLIGDAVGSGAGDTIALVAVLAAGIALVLWTIETETPIAARAADVATAGLGVAVALLPWLVRPEVTEGWPAGWQTAAAIVLFVVGTAARSLQGVGTALPVLAALGFALPLLAAADAFVHADLTRLGEVLLGGGGLLLVVYAGLDSRRVGEALVTRSVRYGGGALLLTALATALAVGAYAVSERNDHTFDLTRKKAFTLSEQAKRVASELAFDVHVTAYFRENADGRATFAALIERFQQAGPRISVEWVDPLRDPRRASEAQITGEQGTIVLEGHDRTRRLEWEVTEDELVRALLLLASDENHEVCWSLGHGEPDPDDESSEAGMGVIRLDLEGLNYTVRNIHPASTGIPRSCRVLVVARPRQDWFRYELESLAAYLASGGRALVLLDPGDAPELAEELVRYGVVVGNDVILDLDDRNRLLGIDDPSFLLLQAANFGTHPITRDLGAAIFAPLARSVRANREPPDGIAVRDFLRTGPMAWGETEPTKEPLQPDEGVEVVGDVPVMAVVEISDPAALRVAEPEPASAPEGAPAEGDPEEGSAHVLPEGQPPDLAEAPPSRGVPADFAPAPGGRLVVIGDGDFPSNQFVGWGNDRDLFLNAVAWLADEEDQIGERPEQGEPLEISAAASALWCLLSVIVVPGIAAAIAGITLIRRMYL